MLKVRRKNNPESNAVETFKGESKDPEEGTYKRQKDPRETQEWQN